MSSTNWVSVCPSTHWHIHVTKAWQCKLDIKQTLYQTIVSSVATLVCYGHQTEELNAVGRVSKFKLSLHINLTYKSEFLHYLRHWKNKKSPTSFIQMLTWSVNVMTDTLFLFANLSIDGGNKLLVLLVSATSLLAIVKHRKISWFTSSSVLPKRCYS